MVELYMKEKNYILAINTDSYSCRGMNYKHFLMVHRVISGKEKAKIYEDEVCFND